MSSVSGRLLRLKFVPYGNRLDVSSSVVPSKRVDGCFESNQSSYSSYSSQSGLESGLESNQSSYSSYSSQSGLESGFESSQSGLESGLESNQSGLVVPSKAKRNSRLSVGDTSNYSRRDNQRYVVSKIAQNFVDLCKDDEDVYFVTLTLREQTDDVNLFKRYMRLFIWRLRNHDIALTYFYVVEKHKSGAYHYHMLIKVKKSLDLGIYKKTVYGKNKKLKDIYISKVFDSLWDFGFNTTILVKGNKMKFISYLSKYLSKSVSSEFPPNFKLFNFSRDCVFVSVSIMVLDKTVNVLSHLMGVFDLLYGNFKHASKVFTFSLDANVFSNVFGVLKRLKKMFFWWFDKKNINWDKVVYFNLIKQQNYVDILRMKMYNLDGEF